MIGFDTLNLQQLTGLLDNAGEDVTSGFIAQFTKRLIEIIYFDRDTTIDDREEGQQLIATYIPAFEDVMASNSELLGQYQEAYQTQLRNAKYFGYGSLAWELKAPGISGEDIFGIIAEPSSGPLIPDYLEIMPADWWAEAKPIVLKTLILDRFPNSENDAILNLASLVCEHDEVAWNVLTEDERNALLDERSDYAIARSIFAGYDIFG